MSRLWFLLSISFLILGNNIEARVPYTPTASAAPYANDYVNLCDWLRQRSMQPTVQRSGDGYTLITRTATLTLKNDSCRVELNRISVWLGHAVQIRNGSLLVTRQDINTTLFPLLFTSKYSTSKPSKIKTIALDPGHGGKDPGNQEGVQKEKHLTLQLAREVRKKLLQAGYNVKLVRDSDRFIELGDRPAIAQQAKADLFVSLHFNSAPRSTGARGVEVYCLAPAGAPSTNGRGENGDRRAQPGNLQDPRNILLAYCMQKSLVTKLGEEDRGVRRARWAVLRTPTIPAILVETGFMSDPAELRRICSTAFRQQQAQAIVEGIQAYQRVRQQ